MDLHHFVECVEWEVFDVGAISESNGVDLFLEQGLLFVVEWVFMSPKGSGGFALHVF